MLSMLSDFLRRWADDISRYGFLGALTGALPDQPRIQPAGHGPKAVSMRGTSIQRRLVQSLARPAAANHDYANRDAEWGPGGALSQRREPTL